MTTYLLAAGMIILACVLLNRISDKVGVPILLIFILLGMSFGSDGIWKIAFDDFQFAEQLCSAALIFIMFYGGFGTNWEQAKPVALQAGILSTLGVVLTAAVTGLFCYLALGMGLLESLLLGSVISSTDAASVFSILRSKKLGLKENTASLLELESGSNDPCSYMMTALVLTVMAGSTTPGAVAYMIFAQFAYGILVSMAVAAFAVFMLGRFRFGADGFDTAFVIAMALIAYAFSSYIGGNGYLSVYLVGIILGNSRIKNKATLVSFFDGITGLMQMTVFFLLGLLSFPSRLPAVMGVSLAVALFLTFVARPAAVFLLLGPFRCSRKQKVLVSFAGLRGAASIVFAIMATVSEAYVKDDVFHIVFCIVLLSIAFQGTLIPWVSRSLDMIDAEVDVRKTFTDYVDEVPVQFTELAVGPDHPWKEKSISEISVVPDMLIVVVIRNGESMIPSGSTVLEEGDRLVLSGPAFRDDHTVRLWEKEITDGCSLIGSTIAEFSKNPDELVVLIRRGDTPVIPRGDTILEEKDILVIFSDGGDAG